MNQPIMLTENAWFDEENNTIVLTFDRISIAFLVEEFMDFYDEIEEVNSKLLSNPRFFLAEFTEEGSKKRMLIRKTDESDDEYNN